MISWIPAYNSQGALRSPDKNSSPAYFYPCYSAILVPTLLIIFVGVRELIMGVITLLNGMKGGGWGEGILGIPGIIFGIVLLANPLIGAAYLPYVLGIFALIGGIGAIISAFLLRPKT